MNFQHYKLFLFDADDTLFDFGASEVEAFTQTLSDLGVDPVETRLLLPSYRAISREMWALLEQKKIAQSAIRSERFRRLFAIAGLKADPEAAGLAYIGHLSRGTHLIPGAIEVCRELKRRGLPIGIVTNGFRGVQEPRFRASPLSSIIDWMLTSEDCGVAKPDPRIYYEALKQATHHEPETVVFVGDRLESDIRGAHAAGIAGCWYNPKRDRNGSGIRPTHEIADLKELLD